mmetsp:Transcript_17297/g.27026  ORF Transcript_17297/g.27026 Transcript_17297/m.27026 type:complete len:353 (-) Transcript_17297:88-1146(-)|eukprot:CAMPEP_0201517388 /NCGR_PEP_ID=MMETSP0161_2-20130828/8501_1 /ASSEMBLY_ACC=CAM_ASM_000251 /TAXON_ID=180227 /ORGANISM="Neoparamoeba aestuarina, Strain SoJaBio B1-5/56/2" /LENGTH=352 /DNA_ID=CAMNT_0047914871 /DNA_START=126 /DNA_END=1184 /DNA_ORIENTATION=-
MGNACGGESETPEEKAARLRSKEIEKQLREAKKQQDAEVKLLLLGSGESGKTTITKQMKILYMDGFSDEERQAFLPVIHSNIILSMRTLILNASKLDIEIDDDQKDLFTSPDILFEQDLTDEYAEAVEALWANEKVKEVYDKRSAFQLVDSCKYFFERVNDFVPEEYVPTDEDILMSRSRTVGCSEISFELDNYIFRLVDVGGQQSERKKWIHQFGDVKSVLFVTSLAEYDLTLMEDEKTNRMDDSLQLFDGVLNSDWFRETPVILFLNKSDLFDIKVTKVDLKCCFPEYTGGKDREAALTFIKDKFAEKNQDNRQLYTHVTCATNTENVEVVFGAVRQECLREMLDQLNMY